MTIETEIVLPVECQKSRLVLFDFVMECAWIVSASGQFMIAAEFSFVDVGQSDSILRQKSKFLWTKAAVCQSRFKQDFPELVTEMSIVRTSSS